VDTQSRCSDGEMTTESTTGSALTHGEIPGENRDSSESHGDNAESTLPYMHAHPRSLEKHSNEKI